VENIFLSVKLLVEVTVSLHSHPDCRAALTCQAPAVLEKILIVGVSPVVSLKDMAKAAELPWSRQEPEIFGADWQFEKKARSGLALRALVGSQAEHRLVRLWFARANDDPARAGPAVPSLPPPDQRDLHRLFFQGR